jgi:predicted porin
MKKTQIALAALALVASTAAMADGVTISGGIDIGMQNTTGGGSRMGSGLLGINVVNLAGSEDLGSGLKADFFLQHRFEAINGKNSYGVGGTINDAGAFAGGKSTFWNQSYVGLSGDFGSVKIGRQIESYALGVFTFDVTGGMNMGSTVTTFVGGQNTTAVFQDNTIRYSSPNINGLTIDASYASQDSLDSAARATGKGDNAVTATYANGPLTLGVGQSKSKHISLGADGITGKFGGIGYDMGFMKANLIYQTATDRGSSTGVNASIPVTGALTLWAGFYTLKNGSAGGYDGNSSAITGVYALSPRTKVFANFQSTTGSVPINVGTSSTGIDGATGSRATTLGVAHSF